MHRFPPLRSGMPLGDERLDELVALLLAEADARRHQRQLRGHKPAKQKA
jgi:hypothetical protein